MPTTIVARRRKLCAIDQRPISSERLQLVGVRKAKTCSPACSTENKRRQRVKGAQRSRNRAKARAEADKSTSDGALVRLGRGGGTRGREHDPTTLKP